MTTLSQTDLGLALLLAHLLADFIFQPDWMVTGKNRRLVLLLHGLIAATLAYGLVGRWALWLVPAWIFISHIFIDYLKVRFGRDTFTVFLLDQTAHLAAIAALAWWFGGNELSIWARHCGPAVWRGWVVVIGAILCVRVGRTLIGLWTRPYLAEIEQAVASGTSGMKPVRGLTFGGRVIGQWERALIFVFVALAEPASIGFLIAAKSVFRFGELKERGNRMEAEYITIGTLMSFGWAILTGYLTWWVVGRM